jgi:hypothetical protein
MAEPLQLRSGTGRHPPCRAQAAGVEIVTSSAVDARTYNCALSLGDFEYIVHLQVRLRYRHGAQKAA